MGEHKVNYDRRADGQANLDGVVVPAASYLGLDPTVNLRQMSRGQRTPLVLSRSHDWLI